MIDFLTFDFGVVWGREGERIVCLDLSHVLVEHRWVVVEQMKQVALEIGRNHNVHGRCLRRGKEIYPKRQMNQETKRKTRITSKHETMAQTGKKDNDERVAHSYDGSTKRCDSHQRPQQKK